MRLLPALLLPLAITAADDPVGAQLYRKHCASCHDVGGDSRIPPQSALRQKSAGSLMKALETGVMRQQGAAMGRSERRTLSTWLGKSEAATIAPARLSNLCAASAWPPPSAGDGAWSGWGVGLSNWRFQSPAQAGLTAGDVPRLKLKWVFGIQDATTMRSQPAVYGGRVFLGTQDGTVYALDAGTGCVHWATEASAQVRTGMVVAVAGGRPPAPPWRAYPRGSRHGRRGRRRDWSRWKTR